MTLVRILGAVLLAAFVHVLVGRMAPGAAGWLDPFLVVVVWFGLRLGAIGSQLLGTAVGLVHDGLTGGLYGLHAFADTVVGYATSLSSGRVVVQQGAVRVLLFAGAALLQQGIVAVLILVVAPERELPSLGSVLLRALVTAVAGGILVSFESRVRVGWSSWQRARSRRLRF